MIDNELIQLVEPNEDDPRIQAAIAELRDLIAARFPDTEFSTFKGEDPVGIYLHAIVDVEDTDEVIDLYIDRLVDFQADEGLPVFVALDWPTERAREYWRRQAQMSRWERLPIFSR